MFTKITYVIHRTIIFCIILGLSALLYKELQIYDVQIHGVLHSNVNLNQVKQKCQNQNLFLCNTKEICKILQSDYWIQNCQFIRKWPHTMEILVSEKIPMALFLKNEKYFGVDIQGRILGEYKQNAKNMLCIKGTYDQHDFQKFLQYVKDYDVKKAVLVRKGRWDITFKNGKKLRSGIDSLKNDLKIYRQISETENQKWSVMDLRNSERIILK